MYSSRTTRLCVFKRESQLCVSVHGCGVLPRIIFLASTYVEGLNESTSAEATKVKAARLDESTEEGRRSTSAVREDSEAEVASSKT